MLSVVAWVALWAVRWVALFEWLNVNVHGHGRGIGEKNSRTIK